MAIQSFIIFTLLMPLGAINAGDRGDTKSFADDKMSLIKVLENFKDQTIPGIRTYIESEAFNPTFAGYQSSYFSSDIERFAELNDALRRKIAQQTRDHDTVTPLQNILINCVYWILDSFDNIVKNYSGPEKFSEAGQPHEGISTAQKKIFNIITTTIKNLDQGNVKERYIEYINKQSNKIKTALRNILGYPHLSEGNVRTIAFTLKTVNELLELIVENF